MPVEGPFSNVYTLTRREEGVVPGAGNLLAQNASSVIQATVGKVVSYLLAYCGSEQCNIC